MNKQEILEIRDQLMAGDGEYPVTINGHTIITVEQMRQADAWTIENVTPSKELMFRAGKGIYDALDWPQFKHVAIVAGSGNNAGDGYVLASLLHAADIKVTIIRLKDKCSQDGQHYFDKCVELGIPHKIYETGDLGPSASCAQKTGIGTATSTPDNTGTEIPTNPHGFDCVVDCILGTGFSSDVRGVAAEAIEAINKNKYAGNDITSSNNICSESSQQASPPKWFVVSCDINSGLNGDTGESLFAVHSNLTISIGYFKPGHFREITPDLIDNVINVDIGIKIPKGQTQQVDAS